MFCKNNNCKFELPDDAVFCLKCGTKQDASKNDETVCSDDNIIESLSENPTRKKTKKVAFIVIGILALIALLYLIYVISNNNNLFIHKTTPTTTSIVETHDYPMERCPIKIEDIIVGSEDSISHNYISAKWKYEPGNTDLVVDKAIFTFTIYDDGKESYLSPKRFTAQGPFSQDVLHQEKWQSSYYFEDADIEKIEIYYTNNLIENYIEISYETQATPQTTTYTTPSETKYSYSSMLDKIEDCPIIVNSYYSTYPNSADGVSFYIDWYSTDEKEIKYIYFTVTPYNRVDDKQYCEIRDHSSFNGKVTGPFYYGSSDYSYWECAWYNNDIDYITLDKITIEYMDGTKRIYYD